MCQMVLIIISFSNTHFALLIPNFIFLPIFFKCSKCHPYENRYTIFTLWENLDPVPSLLMWYQNDLKLSSNVTSHKFCTFFVAYFLISHISPQYEYMICILLIKNFKMRNTNTISPKFQKALCISTIIHQSLANITNRFFRFDRSIQIFFISHKYIIRVHATHVLMQSIVFKHNCFL